MKQKQLVISLVVIVCLVAAFLVGKSFFTSSTIEKLITVALDNSDNIESWSSKSLVYDDDSGILTIEELKILGTNGIEFGFAKLEATGINIGDKTTDGIVVNNAIVNNPDYRMSCNIGSISLSGVDASEVRDFGSLLSAFPYDYSGDSYMALQSYDFERLNCNVDTVNIRVESMETTGSMYIGKLSESMEMRGRGISARMGDLDLLNFSIPEFVAHMSYDEVEKRLRLKYDEFEVLNYLKLEMEYIFADFDPAEISAVMSNNGNFTAMDSFSFAKLDVKMSDTGIVDTLYNLASLQLGMDKAELKRYVINEFKTSNGLAGRENEVALHAAILQFLNDPKVLHFTMNPAEPVPSSAFSAMMDEGDDASLKALNMSISVNGGSTVGVY